VTADDIIFTYEVIADKDYDGVRYNNNIRNIVGIEEFHDGKADTISGIEKINDKEVVITYKEFTPSMLQGGGSVWSSVMPKHVFEDIPVKDMEASDAVRKNPVTFGPYYVSKVIPGESVEFLPNKYYYGEQPKLDKIVMKKVPTASATASIAAKEYDIYVGMQTAEYTSWQNSEGYDILGQQQTSYSYIGFKLGHWDAEASKNKYNPEAKMANKELRQAIGYAIDNETIATQLYNGLQVRANSLIVPAFTSLHDDTFEGFTYNPEKANELLDQAGYKDINDDGIREDPEGNPFKINFAFRDGGDTAQALAEYYIQQWSEVGLDVELTSGRLIEVNSFYEMLETDDPKIDMYQAGWSTGYDPNPTGLYSENGAFNYTRFVSEKNEELLNALSSTEALDPAKAKQLYSDWQAYVFDEAYVIPTTYAYEVVPVSERVTGYDISRDLDHYVYADLGVTAEKR
jgi:peptide/nickel transport system substrate-binding protein